jgi:hypothetical protein
MAQKKDGGFVLRRRGSEAQLAANDANDDDYGCGDDDYDGGGGVAEMTMLTYKSY